MSNRYSKLTSLLQRDYPHTHPSIQSFHRPGKSKAALDERNINERVSKTNRIDRSGVCPCEAREMLPDTFNLSPVSSKLGHVYDKGYCSDTSRSSVKLELTTVADCLCDWLPAVEATTNGAIPNISFTKCHPRAIRPASRRVASRCPRSAFIALRHADAWQRRNVH